MPQARPISKNNNINNIIIVATGIRGMPAAVFINIKPTFKKLGFARIRSLILIN